MSDTITAETEPVVKAPAVPYISVRDEYAPTFGRQNLTLWSGPFASNFEGWAHELPGHDGYMVRLDYQTDNPIRVTCPAPRDDDNYQEVDDAIYAAVAAHYPIPRAWIVRHGDGIDRCDVHNLPATNVHTPVSKFGVGRYDVIHDATGTVCAYAPRDQK